MSQVHRCSRVSILSHTQALSDHPDYGVLVTGYSLGAGIAPLLTMTLMSGEVDLGGGTPQIRCITYGAPPVFQLASGDKQVRPSTHFSSLIISWRLSAVYVLTTLTMQCGTLDGVWLKNVQTCPNKSCTFESAKLKHYELFRSSRLE